MEDDAGEGSLNDALVDAVRAGSLDRVRELLSAGADPNHFGPPSGLTPLHHAAMLGFEAIAEALLAAHADPDRTDFHGVKPLVVAGLAGNHRIARLIRDASTDRREERSSKQLDRLGWSIGVIGGREDEAEFIWAGTEKVDDLQGIIEPCGVAEFVQTDVPFTSFEGWIKQIAAEDLSAITLEAFEAGFPWFMDLAIPPDKMLAAIPEQRAGGPKRFSGRRPRRFAGDDVLPRSRYYTLSKDESGDDAGTLVCEMLAYSHMARTGQIELIDMVDPSASKRLAKLGLEPPASKSLLLVFIPGPGLSPFLLRNGFPLRVVAFPVPVKVIYKRIDKVVDLRLPDTADWFAQAVSQATLHLQSPLTNERLYYKCWPRRRPLDNFGQLLPSMLSQELGGGVLSVAAGALLRRVGANALVFPSARNDPSLRFRDGAVRREQGWNLVDYREAPPPKQMIVVDVDHEWPKNVRIGPGFSIRNGPSWNPFETVTIDYEDSGPRRGSFEVEGINTVLALFRRMDLQNFRDDVALPPWWSV